MSKLLCYCIDFGSFDLDLTIYPEKNMDNKEILKLFKSKLIERIKDHHFDSMRDRYSDISMKDIYGIDMDSDDWDNMIKIVWNQDKPTYKTIGVKKLSSCEGCRLDALSQRYHMEMGGCLAI